MGRVSTTYVRGLLHVRCPWRLGPDWVGLDTHREAAVTIWAEGYWGWDCQTGGLEGQRDLWREYKTWGQYAESRLRQMISVKKEEIEGQQNIIRPCGTPQYQTKSTQNHNESQLMGLIHKNGTYVYMPKFGVWTVAQNKDLKTFNWPSFNLHIRPSKCFIFFYQFHMSKIRNSLNLDTIVTWLCIKTKKRVCIQ